MVSSSNKVSPFDLIGIPWIIHWISFEKEFILNKSQQSWHQWNPHFYFREWNQITFEKLLYTQLPIYSSLYRSLKTNIERENFARYVILFLHGGIYISSDIECKQSLIPFLTQNQKKQVLFIEKWKPTSPIFTNILSFYSSGLLFENDDILLSTSFIASRPYHGFWKCVLHEMYFQKEKKILIPKEWHLSKTSGDVLISKVYHDWKKNYIKRINQIEILSQSIFHPWIKNNISKHVFFFLQPPGWISKWNKNTVMLNHCENAWWKKQQFNDFILITCLLITFFDLCKRYNKKKDI